MMVALDCCCADGPEGHWHRVYLSPDIRFGELIRMTRAKVAQHKRKRPERYCPERRCLWRTGGPPCPRHTRAAASEPQKEKE